MSLVIWQLLVLVSMVDGCTIYLSLIWWYLEGVMMVVTSPCSQFTRIGKTLAIVCQDLNLDVLPSYSMMSRLGRTIFTLYDSLLIVF